MKNILLIAFLFVSSFSLAQEQEAAVEEQQAPLPELDENKAKEDLQSAYRKEYAFLSSQVKNIQSRISEFKQQAKSDKSTMDQQILMLEGQLLALETQANQLDEDIFEVQRVSESTQDNDGLIKATVQQGQSTLSEFNDQIEAELQEIDSDLEKAQKLISDISDVIVNNSKITKQSGQYFLDDGTQVDGDILKVGNIASYGFSSKGSGVLAPAGEKQFKVWKDADNEAISSLSSGNASGSFPIFLYESSVKAIEEKKDKTVKSVIDSGGVIAWIIVILGLFALVLIVFRIWFLKKASASIDKLLNKVVVKIQNKDMDSALKIATSKNSSSARVLSAALRNIDRERDHIEDIVSEAILHESSVLNRFGSLIMVVATVAPLLGLLGTVTGMISTFDIITEFGTGDPKMLSSGISVALVTTEIGLIVAIPALMFGNILSGWAERIKSDMEKAALRAINVYQKSM